MVNKILFVSLFIQQTYLFTIIFGNELFTKCAENGEQENAEEEKASILRHSSKTQQNSGKFAKLFKHSDANRNFTRTKQETLLLLSVAVELQKL